MRRSLVIAWSIGIPLLLFTTARTATVADPGAIVAAERAFADSVRVLGMRDGFLAWLSPTGVLFRPGPVNGVTNLRARAAFDGALSWRPVHAGISADGELGWSTGPWSWRGASGDEQDRGEYLSLWRRQSDGIWRVALDCGVSHAPAMDAAVEPTLRAQPLTPGLASRPLLARQSLYRADAAFAELAAREGVAAALSRDADDDVIVLRPGSLRWRGRGPAHDSLAARAERPRMTSTAQFIAGSADLGYTYGSFVTGLGAAADSTWYVHVWQRGPGREWRLAGQVVLPGPAARAR